MLYYNIVQDHSYTKLTLKILKIMYFLVIQLVFFGAFISLNNQCPSPVRFLVSECEPTFVCVNNKTFRLLMVS